jgi:hypothetical protein
MKLPKAGEWYRSMKLVLTRLRNSIKNVNALLGSF